MQDPSPFQAAKPLFPEQEQLRCPRCDSLNTKFCYYNNYNLSQPRHFCKSCRRYWTKGGALRNIPVGGGSRKNAKRPSNPKRSSPSQPPPAPRTTSSAAQSFQDPARLHSPAADQDRKMLDATGSFSSLLASSGQFGTVLQSLDPDGSALKTTNPDPVLSAGPGRDMEPEARNSNGSQSYLGVQSGDPNCWGGGGTGWPDLAIYTPGSSFQ